MNGKKILIQPHNHYQSLIAGRFNSIENKLMNAGIFYNDINFADGNEILFNGFYSSKYQIRFISPLFNFERFNRSTPDFIFSDGEVQQFNDLVDDGN